jgi:hypothetical protein
MNSYLSRSNRIPPGTCFYTVTIAKFRKGKKFADFLKFSGLFLDLDAMPHNILSILLVGTILCGIPAARAVLYDLQSRFVPGYDTPPAFIASCESFGNIYFVLWDDIHHYNYTSNGT